MNVDPTIKVDDVWEQIAALRASYENTIERADAMIAEANELKREARKGLDALPVAKTRRPKKEKAPEDPRSVFDVARGVRLPGALEMFPDGIERIPEGE